ncbi:hypothetical protein STEG23_002854, partial [Scotinomys teguina]
AIHILSLPSSEGSVHPLLASLRDDSSPSLLAYFSFITSFLNHCSTPSCYIHLKVWPNICVGEKIKQNPG